MQPTGIGPVTTNETAAPAGENRRTAGKTGPVLLVAFGVGSSDVAAVWGHAGQDRSPILSSGVGEPPTGSDFSDERAREGKVSEESLGRAAVSGLGILSSGKTGPFRGRWRHRTLKTRLAIALRSS